ncbi:MAG: PQQ-binding-like beta-propeller repeat protein [Gemmataceae bacterium]
MRLPFAGLVLASCSTAAVAEDWPQWMGPNRDAVWSEANVARDFKDGAPKEKWRVVIGGGYSGPAVASGKVYVTDKMLKPGLVAPKNPFEAPELESTERVLCLDASSGKTVWAHERPVVYRIQYSCGPRCTPMVHDGKVYCLGAMGHLDCFDVGKHTDGKATPIWSKHFVSDFGAKVPTWGFSGHPILFENLLICLVGGDKGAVYALDKDTGKPVWTALSAPEPGYNSPVLIESGGVTQLVVWLPNQLTSLNPQTGEKYWSVKLEPQYAMSIMSPRKEGEHVFAAGIGNVGVTLRLDPNDPKKVTEVWRGKGEPDPKDGVYPVNMTPFVEAGTVYSADQPGTFRAVDLKTGERKWDTFKPIFGEEKPADFKAPAATAFIVKNSTNGLFYLFAETGDLAIAKLSPKGYDELGRVHLLEPMCTALNGRKAVWSHPAFADRCVFARNDKHLVCVPLAK